MAARTGLSINAATTFNGTFAEGTFFFDVFNQLAGCDLFCLVKIVGASLQKEIAFHFDTIFERAEIRTIASALADVEWGLTIVTAMGIKAAQIRQMVQPALLGARTDIDIDAHDGVLFTDTVFAAF